MDRLSIEPLGIDNVMFAVADLDMAIRFYERCGFVLKFRLDAANTALFAIGDEAPGLMLRGGAEGRGHLWVEVNDALIVADALRGAGLEARMIETATGRTCEVPDPFGNVIGFADYSKRPDLGRPAPGTATTSV